MCHVTKQIRKTNERRQNVSARQKSIQTEARAFKLKQMTKALRAPRKLGRGLESIVATSINACAARPLLPPARRLRRVAVRVGLLSLERPHVVDQVQLHGPEHCLHAVGEQQHHIDAGVVQLSFSAT